MLVTAEFVDAYLGQNASPREEVEALIRLVENVIGAANKRHAARWLGRLLLLEPIQNWNAALDRVARALGRIRDR